MDHHSGSVTQAVLLDSLRKFTTVMPYGLGHTKWEVPNLVSPLMQQGQPTAACLSFNLVKDLVTSADFISSFQIMCLNVAGYLKYPTFQFLKSEGDQAPVPDKDHQLHTVFLYVKHSNHMMETGKVVNIHVKSEVERLAKTVQAVLERIKDDLDVQNDCLELSPLTVLYVSLRLFLDESTKLNAIFFRCGGNHVVCEKQLSFHKLHEVVMAMRTGRGKLMSSATALKFFNALSSRLHVCLNSVESRLLRTELKLRDCMVFTVGLLRKYGYTDFRYFAADTEQGRLEDAALENFEDRLMELCSVLANGIFNATLSTINPCMLYSVSNSVCLTFLALCTTQRTLNMEVFEIHLYPIGRSQAEREECVTLHAMQRCVPRDARGKQVYICAAVRARDPLAHARVWPDCLLCVDCGVVGPGRAAAVVRWGAVVRPQLGSRAARFRVV